MAILDFIVIVGFLPTLALILWMIWNREKVIRLEQKCFRVIKAIWMTIKEEIFSKKNMKTS